MWMIFYYFRTFDFSELLNFEDGVNFFETKNEAVMLNFFKKYQFRLTL